MPGEAAMATELEPSSNTATASPQKCFPFVLKKIMDIPPPNILEEGEDEIEKEKLCSSEDVDGGGAVATNAGGGGSGGVSASLTPAIWEKTIPYDGETFHLEYMDLDEFLLENGIPVTLEEEELQKTLTVEDKGKAIPKAIAGLEEEQEEEGEEEEEQKEESLPEEATLLFPLLDSAERNTPSPIDPDAIEVDINFQPDPTDLVLSSVPGGELFNPRKHRFSQEELKPQPMIKKAKKVFVPDEHKDEKYWSRRKKNNLAAKRSRDARRLKENQITVRASFLERENAALRQQVAEMRKDCGRCKNVLARYEAKYGPL
uniref:Thyrotroph embryonic factor-like n=1 Tax=Pundamilia nyererei TaxID=303518 RepID=A0A3B4H9D5_9CICH